jgi:hypothetical protein
MTHKELTKHLRHRLAVAKVPCRVRMNSYCGERVVQVITPTFDARWTPEQLHQIGQIAVVNHLTLARGLPIDLAVIAQLTGATQFDFSLPA